MSFVKCSFNLHSNSGSLTGQHYVDEVLYPHVLQIYQTDGNNFLFQQDNSSIPAIWQGTVCKLVMSYPLDWPFGRRSTKPVKSGGLILISMSIAKTRQLLLI